MAIDTENKRRSTIAVLPIPNSDIDQGDRQQVTLHYRGILAVPPVGGINQTLFKGMWRGAFKKMR